MRGQLLFSCRGILGLPFHKEGNGLRCPVGVLTFGQSRQVVVRLDIPGVVFEDTVDVEIKLRWKEVANEGMAWRDEIVA